VPSNCHFFQAYEWFQGTNEDASGFANAIAGNIEAIVSAVDEVHVGIPRRTEEDRGTGGIAGGGVSGGIVDSEISLDFDDAAGEAISGGVAHQNFAEKFSGDAAGLARKERAFQRSNGLGFFRRRLLHEEILNESISITAFDHTAILNRLRIGVSRGGDVRGHVVEGLARLVRHLFVF